MYVLKSKFSNPNFLFLRNLFETLLVSVDSNIGLGISGLGDWIVNRLYEFSSANSFGVETLHSRLMGD